MNKRKKHYFFITVDMKYFIVFLLILLFGMPSAAELKEIDLNNGNILVINSFQLPSQIFTVEIRRLYENDVRKKECEKEHSVTRSIKLQSGSQNTEYVKYCQYKDYDFSKFWNSYYTLSEEEKEKIYLPLLKQNERYFTAYQKLLKKREAGVYAKIYDKQTNTLINKSKRNYQEQVSDSIILDDGQILLVYNKFYNGTSYWSASKFEIYNPVNNQFIIIPNKDNIHINSFIKLKNNKFLVYYSTGRNYKKYFGILNIKTMKLETADISNGYKLVRPILLSNNKLLFINYTDKEIIIYNPDTNTYSRTGKYLPENTYNIGFIQTDNDIIYLILNKDNIHVKNVFKYDYNSNELEKLGELQGNRIFFPEVQLNLLKDGNIYIQGGFKKCGFDGSCRKADNEIFNIKTCKSHYVKNKEQIPDIIQTKKYHPAFKFMRAD